MERWHARRTSDGRLVELQWSLTYLFHRQSSKRTIWNDRVGASSVDRIFWSRTTVRSTSFRLRRVLSNQASSQPLLQFPIGYPTPDVRNRISKSQYSTFDTLYTPMYSTSLLPEIASCLLLLRPPSSPYRPCQNTKQRRWFQSET